jgi:hypothetical protein
MSRSSAAATGCHPAPPLSGRAPSWINVAVPSRAQGQLLAPGVADLARVAMQRAYERVEASEAAVSLQDAVAAMRLAWQIERDEAIPARDKALAELAEAQQAMLILKDAVIRHSGQGEWRALWGEVQKELERARQIRKTRERFATAARRVH